MDYIDYLALCSRTIKCYNGEEDEHRVHCVLLINILGLDGRSLLIV